MTGRDPPQVDVGSVRPVPCAIRIGPGLALVSSPTFVVVDPDNGHFGERLWALMQVGAGVDELLEELSATGLRSLGDFAMVQLEGEGARVLLRGTGNAHITTGEEVINLAAGQVRTWVEDFFDEIHGFTLSIGESTRDDLPYEIDRGIVPADQLRWTAEQCSPPNLDRLDLEWLEDFEGVDPRNDGHAHPGLKPEPAADPSTGDPRHASADTGEDEGEDGHRAKDVSDRAAQVQPVRAVTASTSKRDRDVEHTRAPDPEDNNDDADPHEPELAPEDGTYDFDALYGETMAKSVMGAAVDSAAEAHSTDAPEPQPVAGGPSLDDATTIVFRPASAVEPDAPATPRPPLPSGLIESVPQRPGVSPAGSPSPPPPTDHRLGDHDGHTISKAQLEAMRSEVSPSSVLPPAAGGPNVQALVCQVGHPNPLHLSQCRLCSAPVGGPPVLIPRPSLGRLRLSSGEVIELDRPAVIGRNPKIEGRMESELPQLVKLDIGQALSRSHAMVRLEGWQVLLEDLGSANGTVVTLPGREARRLRVGEPVLLEAGAIVDLGGGLTATYEDVM